jgi:hypothetical protein
VQIAPIFNTIMLHFARIFLLWRRLWFVQSLSMYRLHQQDCRKHAFCVLQQISTAPTVQRQNRAGPAGGRGCVRVIVTAPTKDGKPKRITLTDAPWYHGEIRITASLTSHSSVELIFTYDSWPIPRPKKLARSPAFHGCWIGHTNGSDRPSNKHFAKRSFHLAKIKPSVHEFLQMTPKLSETYVFIPRISKRSLNFTTIY